MAFKRDHMSGDVLNLEATELRLGLPGTTTTVAGEDFDKLSLATTSKCNKRPFLHCTDEESKSADNSTQSNQNKAADLGVIAPPTKAQVVGWPPIRCYRKNCFQAKKKEGEGEGEGDAGVYVKVSMDGAPFLRKIDLSLYNAYPHLLKALEDMFNCKVGEYCERGYNGSEFAPTYEDKDGDWMLVGDVPWDMFINSCKRLRIMKGSEARGLGGYCV